MKFGPFDTREHVAGMLEGPVRAIRRLRVPLVEVDSALDAAEEAITDLDAIIGELDRLDRVAAAKAKLNADKIKWQREIIAEKVKVVPIEGEEFCADNIGWNGIQHKAKVTLNGMPYCLRHLNKWVDQAKWSFLAANRHSYVEDAVMRAIVDEHKDEISRRERIERGG